MFTQNHGSLVYLPEAEATRRPSRGGGWGAGAALSRVRLADRGGTTGEPSVHLRTRLRGRCDAPWEAELREQGTTDEWLPETGGEGCLQGCSVGKLGGEGRPVGTVVGA